MGPPRGCFHSPKLTFVTFFHFVIESFPKRRIFLEMKFKCSFSLGVVKEAHLLPELRFKILLIQLIIGEDSERESIEKYSETAITKILQKYYRNITEILQKYNRNIQGQLFIKSPLNSFVVI